MNFGDEKKLSERYLKMRAYSRAQNCQYVGEAARTQGIRGGYNADALMIADPRKAKDGRGIPWVKKDTENPVFRYPGADATAPSSKAGYGTEAEQYLERKSSEQDNLRQPDLNKLSEFNANKNNTRIEVTRAALIKDPVCGALANRFDCKKSCTTASRSQCMLMSSQCAYTEGLTCKKSVQRGKRCFKKVCNDKTLDFQKGQRARAYTEMEADCEKEADAVTRSIPKESIQDCKDGEFCPGMCVHYEPTKKEGKIVVEGAKTYKRPTKTECVDKEENVVQCRNGAAMNPDVVEERIVPDTKETCYGADSKGSLTEVVDCKDAKSGEGYADYVKKVMVDDGNPFFMIQKIRNGKFFQETQIDRAGTVSGKCDFLELEQLKTAYDCCMKKKDTSPLVSYYQKKAGIASADAEEPASTTKQEDAAAIERYGKDLKNRGYLQTNWRDRYGYVQAKSWGLGSVARFGTTFHRGDMAKAEKAFMTCAPCLTGNTSACGAKPLGQSQPGCTQLINLIFLERADATDAPAVALQSF